MPKPLFKIANFFQFSSQLFLYKTFTAISHFIRVLLKAKCKYSKGICNQVLILQIQSLILISSTVSYMKVRSLYRLMANRAKARFRTI